MRSKSLTVRFPWPLYGKLETLCAECGAENMHACVIGVCTFAVQLRAIIPRVVLVANANPKIQDFVLDKWFDFPTDLPGMVEALKRLK